MTDNNTSICNTDSPWWAKLIERFGVSTAMLCVLVYLGIVGAQWVSTNVITPVTNQHIEFLRTTRITLDQQTKVLFRVEEAIRERNDIMAEMVECNQSILAMAAKNRALNEEMLNEVRKNNNHNEPTLQTEPPLQPIPQYKR